MNRIPTQTNSDRRRIPITLTERGTELIRTLHIVDEQDPLAQSLNTTDAEQRQQLLVLLRELVQSLPEGDEILEKVSARVYLHSEREPALQGRVLIDGYDVRDVTRDSLQSQIGIVLQDTFLFSESVMDNIRYGRPDATDEEVLAAAKLARADVFIARLPDKYDTVLGDLHMSQFRYEAAQENAAASPSSDDGREPQRAETPPVGVTGDN